MNATPAGLEHPSSIALSFRPNGKLVSATSGYILSLYRSALGDSDEASRVALAAHELMENSAKYSSDGVCHLEVGRFTGEAADFIRITLRNRAPLERLEELRDLLEQIRDAADPIALYQELIIQTAGREHGSGLGLARIRAEAQMEISYTIQGDEVRLVAEMPLRATGGS